MVKSGFKTTEFWLTVASALIVGLTAVANQSLFGNFPQIQSALLISLTVLTSVYSLGRSLVKSSAATNSTAVVTGTV